MATLQDYIARFDREVTPNDVVVDWDGGHAYSSIEHPLMYEALSSLEDSDLDAFEEYAHEWLYDGNEPEMYCEPKLAGYVTGESHWGDGCDEEGTVEYLEGYISNVMDRKDGWQPQHFDMLLNYVDSVRTEGFDGLATMVLEGEPGAAEVLFDALEEQGRHRLAASVKDIEHPDPFKQRNAYNVVYGLAKRELESAKAAHDDGDGEGY